MTKFFATQGATGWKRPIEWDDIADIREYSPSAEDFGISTNHDFYGPDFETLFFSKPDEKNYSGIEVYLHSLNGESIYLLHSLQEIELSLVKGVTDFHMNDKLRQNMAAEFARIEPEVMGPDWGGTVLVSVGFGADAEIKLSVPLDIICTPCYFPDVMRDFAAGLLIDGTKPTDAMRTMPRGQHPNQPFLAAGKLIQ